MFSSRNRVRLSQGLFEQANRLAEARGYSSVEDLVTHLLEQELRRAAPTEADKERVLQKMKGLGYFQ